MSENVPIQLLVALGHAAATEAGGQEGDELFALGLGEHGVLLGVNEQDWRQDGALRTRFLQRDTFPVLEDRFAEHAVSRWARASRILPLYFCQPPLA